MPQLPEEPSVTHSPDLSQLLAFLSLRRRYVWKGKRSVFSLSSVLLLSVAVLELALLCTSLPRASCLQPLPAPTYLPGRLLATSATDLLLGVVSAVGDMSLSSVPSLVKWAARSSAWRQVR